MVSLLSNGISIQWHNFSSSYPSIQGDYREKMDKISYRFKIPKYKIANTLGSNGNQDTRLASNW